MLNTRNLDTQSATNPISKYSFFHDILFFKELGSQPLPTIVTEDADGSGHSGQDQGHRPRAG